MIDRTSIVVVPRPRVPRRLEYTLLAVTAAFGAALRLVWLDPQSSPSFHPALGTVLFIDQLLQRSGPWGAARHWTTLFSSLQGLSLIDRSVVAFPQAVLAQLALGPSLNLPSYLGAFHGVAAVVLAWAAGRAWGGPALGLLFAALLAVSPVEIAWSRIGGLYIVCVPHVLLALVCAQLAARRRSVPLACVAGIVAWLSVYDYYAARLAIPVALCALVAAAPDRRTAVWLVLWYLMPVLLGYAVWSHEGLVQTLWPAVGGGFLPPGERSLASMAALAWERWQFHWLPTLELVFWSGRARGAVPYGCGIESGGMLPLPILVLGIAGIALALAAPRRHGAWLVLAALAYVTTSLSGAEVRRLLLLDVAWNYFAAVAVLRMLGTRPIAVAPRSLVALGAGLALAASGVWSVVAIRSLTRRATAELAPLPFGVGLLGEAIMCRPCSEMASYWRQPMREGELVVLFDRNPARDARIFRMRLRGYGMLAALDAGRPRAFTTACGDWQWIPGSHPGQLDCFVDPRRLRAHVESLVPPPSVVRFYFTASGPPGQPFIATLERLGTVTHPFATLSHVEIVVDGARAGDALDAIARVSAATRRYGNPMGRQPTQ